MHWKTKSRIQNAVSRLPTSLSYASYYWIQRRFGALRVFSPMPRLRYAVDTCRHLLNNGLSLEGLRVLEVGTGRAPMTPIAFWLMGAERVHTYDLNPYAKAELLLEALHYMSANRAQVEALFGELLIDSRLDDLLAFGASKQFSMESVLDMTSVDYLAPADAGSTALAPSSIDLHTSRSVLEHIPDEELKRIFDEGARVLSPGGIMVHQIDYTDHFSHSDPSISQINFLQFSADEWSGYANNKYMFMNRLRHDDFVSRFTDFGLDIVAVEKNISDDCLKLLETGGLSVHKDFSDKDTETLCTTDAWFVLR